MGLTKKLATLSRQDRTRAEAFDINVFLMDLESLLQHTLPSSVDLAVTLSNVPVLVQGDRSQLEQVLLNLCFNARDAIEAKGHIRLQAGQQTVDRLQMQSDPQLGAGEYAVISVEDDGHGIEEDTLPRIFDPFFTTKGSNTGTGLGLANSYTIVEQHGGTITVESTLGEGSCFTVYLPLARPEASETATDTEPRTPARELTEIAGGLVLVADDNPQLRELARALFENAGFETCTAADGKQALELYKARKDEIRLLFLDLVMPEMSGQEVASAVREMSEDVRILFVSGYVPEQTMQSLKEPIIRKPYTIHELTEALANLA